MTDRLYNLALLIRQSYFIIRLCKQPKAKDRLWKTKESYIHKIRRNKNLKKHQILKTLISTYLTFWVPSIQAPPSKNVVIFCIQIVWPPIWLLLSMSMSRNTIYLLALITTKFNVLYAKDSVIYSYLTFRWKVRRIVRYTLIIYANCAWFKTNT